MLIHCNCVGCRELMEFDALQGSLVPYVFVNSMLCVIAVDFGYLFCLIFVMCIIRYVLFWFYCGSSCCGFKLGLFGGIEFVVGVTGGIVFVKYLSLTLLEICGSSLFFGMRDGCFAYVNSNKGYLVTLGFTILLYTLLGCLLLFIVGLQLILPWLRVYRLCWWVTDVWTWAVSEISQVGLFEWLYRQVAAIWYLWFWVVSGCYFVA
eukprot:gene2839-1824_t